ncbi:MAG: hypothetical protein MZV70_33310 [Desulfobacterales bacterium]|nr:hypothetical protein [Desulfobacterales bacterium]
MPAGQADSTMCWTCSSLRLRSVRSKSPPTGCAPSRIVPFGQPGAGRRADRVSRDLVLSHLPALLPGAARTQVKPENADPIRPGGSGAPRGGVPTKPPRQPTTTCSGSFQRVRRHAGDTLPAR